MPKQQPITPADAFRMGGKQLRSFGPKSMHHQVAQAELARRAAKRTPEVAPAQEAPARLSPPKAEVAQAAITLAFDGMTPKDWTRLNELVKSL